MSDTHHEGSIECKDPHLGLATTHQLILELMARSEVSRTIGEEWPNYSTVGGR